MKLRDQLDLSHRRPVTPPRHQLHGAREAASATLVAGHDLRKQLAEHFLVVQLGGAQTPGVQVTTARGADQSLDFPPQLRRLGLGGLQALVSDQVRHEIADQRQAVAGGPSQLSHRDAVTHERYSSSVSVASVPADAPLAETPAPMPPSAPSGSTPCSCSF